MRGFTAVATSLLLAALATLGPARPAWSHADLVKSSPANGVAVAQAPAEVRAWFSEELAVKPSTLRLYDAHNKLLASGGIDPKVAKHDVMRLAAPHLTAGTYLVRWHAVTADDNKATEGSFRFSVKGAATTPPPTMAKSLPPIRVTAPASQAVVRNPVALMFETPADMTQYTMGGMASMEGMGPGLHLHIIVDGATTLMPNGEQVTKVGDHRYRYALPRLSAGSHTVKVFWADNKTHAARGPVQAVSFACSQ